MRKSLNLFLAFLSGIAVSSGCGHKQILSDYVIARVYNGNYNGFEVGIEEKKHIRREPDHIDTLMSSIECNMLNRSNEDSPWEIIHGEDRNYDGQWDVINVTAKSTNDTSKHPTYFDVVHPEDLIDARNNLDKAVSTIGNKEYLIKRQIVY